MFLFYFHLYLHMIAKLIEKVTPSYSNPYYPVCIEILTQGN